MEKKEMLEKIDSLNTKAVELKTLNEIQKSINNSNENCEHFEFVEHYGLNPARIKIPRKYNQRLVNVINQIADDIEKELVKEFS